MGYDAFISYSRQADAALVPEIQTGLHQIAKPWFKLRASRVFYDENDLESTEDLDGDIFGHLDESEHLILLASEESAGSPYVDSEVAHWLEKNDGPENIHLVLTGGHLEWDRERNDWHPELSNALPAALVGAFATQPRYVDMRWVKEPGSGELALKKNKRFLVAIADIAGPIRGIEKDKLVNLDHKLHRRNRIIAWFLGCVLAVLLIGFTYAAFEAWRQLNIARDKTEAADAAEARATAALDAEAEAMSAAEAADAAAKVAEQREADAEKARIAADEAKIAAEVLAGQAETAAELARIAQEVAEGKEADAAEAQQAAEQATEEALALKEAADLAAAEAEVLRLDAVERQRLAEEATATAEALQTAAEAEATKQFAIADSVRLAGLAGEQLALDRVELAALLAIESVAATASVPSEPVVSSARLTEALVAGQLITPSAERAMYSVAGSAWRATMPGQLVGWHHLPGDQFRLATEQDGIVRVWDGAGSLLVEVQHDDVGSVVFDDDGSRFVTVTSQIADLQVANVWAADGSLISTHEHDRAFGLSAAFDPTGERLMTRTETFEQFGVGEADGIVRIWSPDGGVERLDTSGWVTDAAFSADGRHIVTVAAVDSYFTEYEARLWDDAGEWQLLEHDGVGVGHAVFSPTDDRVLTVGNGQAVIWSLDGFELATLTGVEFAAFDSTGERIVTYGTAPMTLWTSDGEQITTLDTDGAPIADVQFDANGGLIVAMTGDLYDGDGFRVWDGSGAPVDVASTPVNSMAVSPDGTRIVTEAGVSTVWAVDTGAGTVVRSHEFAPGSVDNRTATVVFAPDGRRVVTGGEESTRLWDSSGGARVSLSGSSYGFHPMTGAALTITSGIAQVWDVNGVLSREFGTANEPIEWAGFGHNGELVTVSNREVRVLTNGFVPRASFRLDGRSVTSAELGADGDVLLVNGHELWNLDGSLRARLGSADEGWSTRFSPDGTRILTFGSDGPQLWNLDGVIVASFAGRSGYAWDARFSGDGRRLVSYHDGVEQVWDTNGTLLATFDQGSVVVSHDGELVAVLDGDQVAIRRLDGSLVAELGHDGEYVNSVSFDPRGTLVATGADTEARLWDLGGELLASMDHPQTDRTDVVVSFSPDGTRLLTNESGVDFPDEYPAMLWNLDGSLLQRFPAGSGVFGPDGRFVALSSSAGTSLWRVYDAAGLVDEVTSRLGGRQLTALECSVYDISPCPR